MAPLWALKGKLQQIHITGRKILTSISMSTGNTNKETKRTKQQHAGHKELDFHTGSDLLDRRGMNVNRSKTEYLCLCMQGKWL